MLIKWLIVKAYVPKARPYTGKLMQLAVTYNFLEERNWWGLVFLRFSW